MRTRRRTYTAATPPSLLPEALPVSGTKRRKCTAKAKGNRGSKKFTGLWDLYIPSELLQEILSRLGLKANIQSSVVCKAWCEAAVSVRKLQRRPLLFNAFTGSTHILELADPLRSHESQRLKVDFPVLEDYGFSYSKDGWVLARSRKHKAALFLNPFTHSFKHFNPGHTWAQCLFSNGVFYCLGNGGHLRVFDLRDATWNVLPVEPCPGYCPELVHFRKAVNMTEHEGDIFLIYTKQDNSTPTVFKLNLKRNVWEEKRDLGGLTVFTSVPGAFIRAGLSSEERNRIYPSYTYEHGKIGYGMYLPLPR